MQLIALLLSPFTLIYYLVMRFRNHLYNIGYKRSFQFDTKVIAVGNLSVGGTGKSPMIEYIISLLAASHDVATLSRGYGRNTKGFKIAKASDDAKTIGDEPYQFYRKFKDKINVTVGEDRALAIPNILFEIPQINVILLDDAFQHRSVIPNLNILLTDFNKPFYRDFVLPGGRLREPRKGAGRADIIVVTKCPEDLKEEDMAAVKHDISRYSQPETLFLFSAIKYMSPEPVTGAAISDWTQNVYLFTGIANSEPIRQYIADTYRLIGQNFFNDHHNYKPEDIRQIKKEFDQCAMEKKVLVTTEKDMVKLLAPALAQQIKQLPIFYLPIKSYFLKNGHIFDGKIKQEVEA